MESCQTGNDVLRADQHFRLTTVLYWHNKCGIGYCPHKDTDGIRSYYGFYLIILKYQYRFILLSSLVLIINRIKRIIKSLRCCFYLLIDIYLLCYFLNIIAFFSFVMQNNTPYFTTYSKCYRY